MKTHEKWAVAAAVGAVLSHLISIAISSSVGSQPWVEAWWWAMLGIGLRSLLTQLVVGLWLAWTARKDGRSPIAWFALGLVFSLLAALLYFLLRILERTDGAGSSAVSGASHAAGAKSAPESAA